MSPLSSDSEAIPGALADQVVAVHGRIDVAFDNAGISDSMYEFHALDIVLWNRMITVNLPAPPIPR